MSKTHFCSDTAARCSAQLLESEGLIIEPPTRPRITNRDTRGSFEAQ